MAIKKKSSIKKKIIKMSKEKIDTNFIKKTKILSDKENFKIEWNSKFLILKIWDSNQEDGDKISINLNGENQQTTCCIKTCLSL